MEVRADKFLSGHYAYFCELPDRKCLEDVVQWVKTAPFKQEYKPTDKEIYLKPKYQA
ncbi:MAG: hypothetical protein ABIC91_08125 [Nanoarchaeota archaeon]|nr:hypothetical protein [Nanoarchaeota archaeon]MBU1031053.1 hypothetical protein [Nanoarchaeota archaeon]MBU1850093.1 hypothetical protein [Nanoarchaeota archaeon]